VAAQWLNYRTPGVPRTKDGKPRLDAPAPRALDGHPDLSGVWMHERASLEEMRQIFGARFDETLKVDVPGMELARSIVRLQHPDRLQTDQSPPGLTPRS
jgi:hypothetical protein